MNNPFHCPHFFHFPKISENIIIVWSRFGSHCSRCVLISSLKLKHSHWPVTTSTCSNHYKLSGRNFEHWKRPVQNNQGSLLNNIVEATVLRVFFFHDPRFVAKLCPTGLHGQRFFCTVSMASSQKNFLFHFLESRSGWFDVLIPSCPEEKGGLSSLGPVPTGGSQCPRWANHWLIIQSHTPISTSGISNALETDNFCERTLLPLSFNTIFF